jgi:hypothetical protein
LGGAKLANDNKDLAVEKFLTDPDLNAKWQTYSCLEALQSRYADYKHSNSALQRFSLLTLTTAMTTLRRTPGNPRQQEPADLAAVVTGDCDG